jgi:hypothetical protein
MTSYYTKSKNAKLILEEAAGKKLRYVVLADNKLTLGFANKRLSFYDDGQNCCEQRYMVCDDDLSFYENAEFYGIEVKDGPAVEVDYDHKECQFLIVRTSAGEFTVANYNKHNGWYGGFSLVVKEEA